MVNSEMSRPLGPSWISHLSTISDTMENSYPGAIGSHGSHQPKNLFNPLLYRTRHHSLARPLRQENNQRSSVDLDGFSQRSDFIPLLASAGLVASESLQENGMSKEEAHEKMEGLSQLISRLEDTTALLRDQLHSVKKTLKGSKTSYKPAIIRPLLPWLFKYQILIVAAIQLFVLSLLTIYDVHYKGNKAFDSACKVFLVIGQTLNTAHVILATVKLSKKLKMGGLGTVMAQTYFATVLVFAGLYLSFYRFNHASWEFAANDELKKDNAFVQFVRMLYLSVSSATLCGAANIQPKAWYVTLIVCFQSLINFVYFASILAQTIGNFASYTVSVRHRDSIVNDALQPRPSNVNSLSSSVRNYGSTPG